MVFDNTQKTIDATELYYLCNKISKSGLYFVVDAVNKNNAQKLRDAVIALENIKGIEDASS